MKSLAQILLVTTLFAAAPDPAGAGKKPPRTVFLSNKPLPVRLTRMAKRWWGKLKETRAKAAYRPIGLEAELAKLTDDQSSAEHRGQVTWTLALAEKMFRKKGDRRALEITLTHVEKGLAKKAWRQHAVASHHEFRKKVMPPEEGSRRKASLIRTSQPAVEDLEALAKAAAAEGIRPEEILVLNLRHENNQEARYARAVGVKTGYLDIVDHTAPTLAQIKKVLEAVADPSFKQVVVHCSLGRGRAGVMIAAIRIALDGWSVKDALREAYDNGLGLPIQDFAIRDFGKRWEDGEITLEVPTP